jgi:hypothetical protein
MDRVTSTDGDLLQYKAWFKADRDHSAKWRKTAREDFEFLAGEQWTEDEKRDLKAQMRPAITFNRTHTVINAISGMEVANRQEVKYFPREQGDAKANELLTEGSKWFRDQADADDEDSDAFLDASVCGMGWTETTMDYEEEDEGCPTMSAVNPLEMYWDKNSRKKNVSDAQRLWRVREVPIARALDMFPDAHISELDAKWAQVDREGNDDESQEEADRYEGESDKLIRDDKCVTIVHLQLKKRVPVYVVADPTTGAQTTMSAGDHKKLKARMAELGMPLISTRKDEMQVENIFIGAKVLQAGPALCKKHFSFQCVTAYMDRTTGLFYGLMRMMKDPQRWANKWMLQALHILNSNAKGGLMAEKGAVEDHRQFEKDWARPDKINWLEDGAVSAQRIKEKPQPQMPASFFQMMQFAIEAVREVPGVSLELLGQRDADQPASLEYQRRQAGMTILAPLFDNLKRYRRDHGKLMLYIIQKYLADGRLVRIVGEEGAQYVPLALNADTKYDIVIDDQPNSPDQKMLVWQTLVPMMKLIPPQILLSLLEYSPLPTSVVEKIKAEAGKMAEQQSQQPDPEMVRAQAQAGLAEAKKAQTELDMQASQMEFDARQQELATQAVLSQRELVAELARLSAEAANENQKGQIDALLGQQKIRLGELAIELAQVNVKNARNKPKEARRAENARAA